MEFINIKNNDARLLWLFLSYQTLMICNLTEESCSQISHKIGRDLFFAINAKIGIDGSCEIGAHEASYSRRINELLPGIKVYAFEASPIVYEKYKDSFNDLAGNIQYLNMVISDSIGKSKFNVVYSEADKEYISALNSILNRNLAHKGMKSQTVNIDSTTLDEIIYRAELNNTSLWIDVEGAIREVFSGARAALSTGKIASIYVEAETIAKWQNQSLSFDLISFLYDFGYLPIYKDFECNNQANYIFLRNDFFNGNIIYLISSIIKDNLGITSKISELQSRIKILEEKLCSLPVV